MIVKASHHSKLLSLRENRNILISASLATHHWGSQVNNKLSRGFSFFNCTMGIKMISTS